ncbi:MAG: hypothetical protein J0H44_13545 [Alphaproteobacteria bacterium]|nr:hypothetical protein [Alphaproteobacteria bacterium]
MMTLHDLAQNSPRPVGVECIHCIHRALFTAKELRAKRGDMRTLSEAGVYCGNCGSRQFSVERFMSWSKAHAFMRNI